MDTLHRDAIRTKRAGHSRAFDIVQRYVLAYGAFAAAALVATVVVSMTGQEVSSFMWGRSCGVFASSVLTYWLTALAARGKRWAYQRVRVLSVAVPVAIVAIDGIPGLLPVWFVAAQIAGALVLAPTAFIVNRSALSATFREGR